MRAARIHPGWAAAPLLAGLGAALAWPEGPPPGAEAAATGPPPARAASAAAPARPAAPAPEHPQAPPAAAPPSRAAIEGREAEVRRPRPDGERAYREDARAWAREDRESFAREARERLAGPAPLAEKAGLLRAARDADPVLADELCALALDPERPSEPALRELALRSLILRSGEDGVARARLYAAAVSDRRGAQDLRERAARAVFASASEAEIAILLAEVERARDPPVWREALRGHARNPAPGARGLLQDILRTRTWDPIVQAAAAGAAEGAPDAQEPETGREGE